MKVNGEAIYSSRPMAPYQAENFCFTQSRDGKTKYLFYLVGENEALPASVDLPAGFAGKASEIGLLGHPASLKIQIINQKTSVNLPKSFLKNSAASPAIVFMLKEK
jgi:alpha-L-fucosidase